MKVHKLKIEIKHFLDVLAGNKRAEIRFNDRGYQFGDILILSPVPTTLFEHLTHNPAEMIFCEITHIVNNVNYLQPGFVMLSIDVLSLDRALDRLLDDKLKQQSK